MSFKDEGEYRRYKKNMDSDTNEGRAMNRDEMLQYLVENLTEWPDLLDSADHLNLDGDWVLDIHNNKSVFLNNRQCALISEGAWRARAKMNAQMHDCNEDQSIENSDSGAHYRYDYKGIKLDPYRILDVYGITSAPQQHAIKKLLRAGDSVKGKEEDIKEVIDTLNRWLDMLAEDDEVV